MKQLLTISALLLATVCFGQYKTELVVAQDGSGDFKTIQAAIDGAKSYPDQRITIHIRNGIYEEKVKVHTWNSKITLSGESADGTIISWGDHFDQMQRGRNSTFHTPTLLVQGDEFHAENLTIENTAGAVGQAVAVSVEADRATFNHCRFLGNQDTLFADGAHSRQHYKNCYIEGTTDFIFGAATALFEECTIHCKSNSYISAASTPAGQPYGFVFLHCQLTAAKEVTEVYLGRPWRSYAKTVFIGCDMGAFVRPEGWDNWGSTEKEETVFYAEYGNEGPGAQLAGRVSWAKQLSRKEAQKYKPENVLKGYVLPEWTGN